MTKKKHIFLIIFSIVVALLGREIYKYSQVYAQIEDVPAFQTMGPEDSPIRIIEFVDYNCPHCRSINPVVQDALELRDDIHYIARPIGPLGDDSERLVKLTLAAGLQGKFWELHHAFLSHRGSISRSFVDQKAQDIGLDLDQLYTDASSEEVQQLLNANIATSGVLGIRYIPAFMINKTVYVPQNSNITSREFLRVIVESSQ